jgi:hypothetical protein
MLRIKALRATGDSRPSAGENAPGGSSHALGIDIRSSGAEVANQRVA